MLNSNTQLNGYGYMGTGVENLTAPILLKLFVFLEKWVRSSDVEIFKTSLHKITDYIAFLFDENFTLQAKSCFRKKQDIIDCLITSFSVRYFFCSFYSISFRKNAFCL